MFCPKCKAEYREGFTECADCKVALVWALDEPEPPDHEFEDVEFVKLLYTYNLGDIVFIKSVLDEQDIVYFIQGENFTYVRGGIEPAVLMVKKQDVDAASELLKDMDITFLHYKS